MEVSKSVRIKPKKEGNQIKTKDGKKKREGKGSDEYVILEVTPHSYNENFFF